LIFGVVEMTLIFALLSAPISALTGLYSVLIGDYRIIGFGLPLPWIFVGGYGGSAPVVFWRVDFLLVLVDFAFWLAIIALGAFLLYASHIQKESKRG